MTDFPLSCVYMYDSLTSQWFFWIWELPCPCHFLFQIKEVNVENVSKPICVSKRPSRTSGLRCVWYAQRHLSLIYLFREKEKEIEGEVLQESVLPPWDMMLLDFDHWHLLFHASRKNKASLPLRNYSNDLQQCMFSYSFVVGIWEHILTSQLLMQGSE